MKSRKPIGVSRENWRKVTETQTIACQEMLAKRKQEQKERALLDVGISPASAAFSSDGFAGGTPGTADIFSPRPSRDVAGPLLSMRNSTLMTAPPSARSASSQATRTPGTTGFNTPGFATPGGVEAATTFGAKPKGLQSPRGDAQRSPQDGDIPEPSPSSTVFQASSPNFDGFGAAPEATQVISMPTQVVVGTDQVVMMLEHCEEIVNMKSIQPTLRELDDM